jgi:cullin 5
MEQNNYSSRNGSSSNKSQPQLDNYVKKLMLDTWSKSIFSEIKQRLQNSAMKIIYSERIGESFDSQLVIGVRESYGKFKVISN